MATIYVESMVSSRTGTGMVVVVFEPENAEPVSVQLERAAATQIGMQLIQAATVAQDDELIHSIAGEAGPELIQLLRRRRHEQDTAPEVD